MEHTNEGMATVNCPRCGGEWTHHERIEVFARQAEDGRGVAYAVDVVPGPQKGPPAQTSSALKEPEEFLGRRGDVRVRFRCEDCTEPFWLSLVQHKGQSLITVADTPRFGG